MKLSYTNAEREPSSIRDKWPHGYWYVITDDGGYDAVGPDPLGALVNLVAVLEDAVREKEGRP